MAGVKVTGVEMALRAIGKAKTKDAIAVADGLEKCANIILRKSNFYVPVDTEALKKSGRVEKSGSGMGARAEVVYGGEDAPYALYVHENMQAAHAAPTQAKFLERATRETRGAWASVLKRELEAGKVKRIDGEVVK